MNAFIGEIRLLPFDYAPEGWLLCNGQRLPVQTYQALFSVIGTLYGGDGVKEFHLPDMRVEGSAGMGAAAVGMGTAEGLTPRTPGEPAYGAAEVTLTLEQMPAHGHAFSTKPYTSSNQAIPGPAGNYVARGIVNNPSPSSDDAFLMFTPLQATGRTVFRDPALSDAGGGLPHENRQPALSMNFCIAADGEYPSPA